MAKRRKTTKMEIETRLVTPAEAKAYLGNNAGNRNLSEKWVNFYHKQMANGDWVSTGDTIKFDKKDKLRDGQHRLNALIRHGKPVELSIARGVPDEAFPVLDTGKRRSTSDVLGIEGHTNALALAGAVKYILLFESGYFTNDSNSAKKIEASNPRVLEFIEDNPEIHEVVKFCGEIWRKFRFMPQSSLTMLYWILSKRNQTDCDTFFGKYSTGVDIGETSPIRALRDRLLKNSISKAKINNRDKAALFIKAWNAYRQNKRVQSLMLERNYVFPKPL